MQTTRVKSALFGDVGPAGETINEVYGHERLEYLRRITDLYPAQVTRGNIETCLPDLDDLEVIFATWGMFPLSPAQLDRLPNLRAVFYAGGSVRYFVRPFLERGVFVTSAWQSNAVPVAEFSLAQILLAVKGYWRNTREYAAAPNYEVVFRGPGCYGEEIALLGAGAIGRALIELLRPFRFNVLIFDPFLSVPEAEALGVEKVSLEEAFVRGFVVSNHLADNDRTEGMIDGALLARLRPGATFINTGRGRTVVETELVDVLRRRPDMTALLDVTNPEPMPLDAPLRGLPNAVVSGHIAGSIGDEIGRMADCIVAEFTRYAQGESLHCAVTLEMLDTMA